MTTGVLAPASYLLYVPKDQASLLPKGSPLEGSGLEANDRIVAIDGEQIFSLQQLSAILNDNRVLITVQRGKEVFLRRLPRVQIDELKIDNLQKEELTDWQWEAGLKADKLAKLFFIPYNLTADCVVEEPVSFFDTEKEEQAFSKNLFSELEQPLQRGDRLLAVNGTPVASAHALFHELQTKKVLVVVEKQNELQPASWKNADELFDRSVSKEDLKTILNSIGTKHEVKQAGQLRLLNQVVPKTRFELFQMQDRGIQFQQELEEERKNIQAIDNVEKRQAALKYLEKQEKQLLLGLPGVQDLHVTYNPNPFTLFEEIVDEVTGTLSALVGGYLNPKWLSGPIGIVQVIHQHWMLGIKEALFWIGIISMNLGLLNLLPLPVLDGGYIALSIFELATGARLKSKTIEKIVVPFAILLIGFLVFLTYHDIVRLLSNLLKL